MNNRPDEMTETDRRTFNKVAASLGFGAILGTGRAMAASAEPPGSTVLAPPDEQAARVKMPEKPQKKPGWAIVGLGQLAIEEILPAFGQAKVAALTALVSGHPDKAKRLAEIYDVKAENIYGYGNFDEIVNNRDVDVVYIVLPNYLLAVYKIRALKAG